MLTGHLEGYRIPRGEQTNNAEGRLPFLPTYSCQCSTIFAPLKPEEVDFWTATNPQTESSLRALRSHVALTQAHTGSLRDEWGAETACVGRKGRGGNWSKPSDPLMVSD